ncbi:alpha-amylase family protein [Pedobacter rhizosphaerae]|uniref:Alpha-galactosidase n=1 Tax=Pedobacter rhizosphaerae TaxID=390241 RepID=A0A1H9QYW7_9SPHI|nr:hypothetical protein [Pedobacter rhizosphaerae]SER65791.1 alpha-galactosidase [Pedobacter rhizosphaerae]
MMKYLSTSSILMVVLVLFLSVKTTAQEISFGKNGIIKIDRGQGNISAWLNGQEIASNITSSLEIDGKTVKSSQYTSRSYSNQAYSDALGKGRKHVIKLSGVGLPNLQQVIYTYPGHNYFVMQLVVTGENLKTNHIIPIHASLKAGLENPDLTTLIAPFDNDTFISYEAKSWAQTDQSISAELGVLYSNATRNGLVMGSLQQADWKTGIKTQKQNANAEMSAICGYTAYELTRDRLAHGFLSGNTIASAKVLFGYFPDWRLGMEEFAKAVKANQTRVVFKWNKPTPIGWNSWGVMQEKISQEKAMKVVDFFADSLKNFRNDGVCFVDLDSYWDNLVQHEDYSKLKAFADYCKSKGLKPGIYWAPFTDWGFAAGGDRKANGVDYNFSEMWTKIGKGYHDFDGARALDPTHPGTLQRIKYMIGKFKACGFEMIKIDFLGHAAVESDHFYNAKIQTGMQAYRFGMDFLLQELDNKMLVYAAISPSLATAPYVHVRRIACDAFKSINDTKYTLNSVTNGWWQTHLYDYVDGDHVVLGTESYETNVSRMLSAIVTGTFICGDDFSQHGPWTERAKKLFQNQEVLAVLKDGKAFQPVEGALQKEASNLFIKHFGNKKYLAIFNYNKTAQEIPIHFERLNIAGSFVEAKELISGTPYHIQNHTTIKLQPEQAILLQVSSSH